MTLGNKICYLRKKLHISQEELADKLNVSRQSISKWEMDQSLPQIDKIILLSNWFNVSLDSLLMDDISIDNEEVVNKTNIENHYFATDGIRGEANTQLNGAIAYKIGRFLGWFYQNKLSGCHKSSYHPRIVVGKDTRRSSYLLESSIVSGIVASGADAYMLHVTTTPSVSYIAHKDDFDCGIMISASHNPYYDNGIKIVNRNGEKIDDSIASYIESYLDNKLNEIGVNQKDLPIAIKDNIGTIIDYAGGRNRYIAYLISLATQSFRTLNIGLDLANGASWMIGKSVFESLGAKVTIIGDKPNGININNEVGSTHIQSLVNLVKSKNLDVGFAFDGDADRCIAVDEKGNVVDGDKILYVLANRLKRKGELDGNKVVCTIMSNSGLLRSLEKEGINYEITKVGDRFVYEKMISGSYQLGGENYGHRILRKYATTGDGILTAIMIVEEMLDTKTKLSKLAKGAILSPQLIENIAVKDKEMVLNDMDIIALKNKIEKKIGKNGRILLRKSGTEPVIRVLVETETEKLCQIYINEFKALCKKKGYSYDR